MTRREPCPVCGQPVDPKHAVLSVYPREAVVHHGACHRDYLRTLTASPAPGIDLAWCSHCATWTPDYARVDGPHRIEDHWTAAEAVLTARGVSA